MEKRTVLFVDDEEDVLRSLKRGLLMRSIDAFLPMGLNRPWRYWRKKKSTL